MLHRRTRKLKPQPDEPSPKKEITTVLQARKNKQKVKLTKLKNLNFILLSEEQGRSIIDFEYCYKNNEGSNK